MKEDSFGCNAECMFIHLLFVDFLGTNADIKYDYTLTEEFCREHFLAGLVLREVGFALHDVTEVRQYGIRVLRNLLAKHSFDDRYTSKVSLKKVEDQKELKKKH